MAFDRQFSKMEESVDIKYYRYMDDVRIFFKDYAIARRCLFDMERIIRKLHLNVQSAKTKILDEKLNTEITNSLIDTRIDRLKSLRDILGDHKQKAKIVAELR